jgi:hypothetical protein
LKVVGAGFSCAASIPTQDAKNTALVMRRQKQEEIKDYLKRPKLITKQDIQLMKIMPLRNVTAKKKMERIAIKQ